MTVGKNLKSKNKKKREKKNQKRWLKKEKKMEKKENDGQYEHFLFLLTFEFGTDACFFVLFC